MVDSPWFWTRVGGVGGIVFFVSLVVLIALMPLSHAIPEPPFDAPSNAFLAYAKSEADLPFALSLVGVLGLFGLPCLRQFSRSDSELRMIGRMPRRPWSYWQQASSLFSGWLSWHSLLPRRSGALTSIQLAQASYSAYRTGSLWSAGLRLLLFSLPPAWQLSRLGRFHPGLDGRHW